MSREIKFRAWDGEKFRYPNLIDITGITCYTTDGLEPGFFYPDVLQQFTGLIDKNGKEIYEGDILQTLDAEYIPSECGSEYEDCHTIGTIYWNEDRLGWDLTNRVSIEMDELDMNYTEIIGNVHESPELLNNGNN